MPDKRQTSKQRRAARNRATRDALAARTQAATRAAGAPSSASSRATAPPDAAPNGAPPGGTVGGSRLLGSARGRRRPGDMAVLLALGLSIVSAISMLFLRVDVDDRGEPLPTTFKGVAIAAREAITGEEMPDRSESLIEANGAGVLLYIALPVAVAAFAFWANRRPDRGRLLTFAMLAMAGAVLLGGGFLFFPSLIALAVASFQVRKSDMPARMADRVTSTGPGRGGAIDAESEELGDAPDAAAPPDAADDEPGVDDELGVDDEPGDRERDRTPDRTTRRDGVDGAGGSTVGG